MSNKKIKLVFITRPIIPPWDEGSKNLTLYIAEKIISPSLMPYVLTGKFAEKYLPKNIGKIKLFSNDKFTFITKIKLFFFLLKTDADIIHFIFATTPLTSIIIKIILALKKTKSVQTVSSLEKAPYFLYKFMFFGNKIICLSKTTEKKLKKININNTYLIPPTVDVNKFIPGKKSKKIAFLGELYRMESYPLISKLIPLITKTFPEYKIVLGFRLSNKLSKEKELKEKLKKNFSSIKNLEWIETIDNMPHFLSETKIVVFPAKNMTGKFDLPLVLIEALSSATPIVISPIEPLNELSTYKGVITSNENNAKSFLDAISSALEKKSYGILSRNARKNALNFFSINKNINKYKKIYGELDTH